MVFSAQAVEDRTASIEAGHYVAKEIHMAKITPPGGHLVVERPVADWLAALRSQCDPNLEHYENAYAAWRNNQDAPVQGTPLKEWPPIGVAQLEACRQADIHSVEDLANISDGALVKLGMGAMALKRKAQTWLESAATTGRATEEALALKTRIKELEQQIAKQKQTIESLQTSAKPATRRPRARKAASAKTQE
ncbi:hypothetical protein MAIT1_03805 [Magnetofaba australis IT-1]|uniref:Uncharacterized protein n=1 Tax=Magnetofaba australis IT-1 TaxID=1434232 RepID=A0A1Y2K4N3_9PROT|nr:hypothetical protein MAIT1_03805 [Magnetofaba australis IT-1]